MNRCALTAKRRTDKIPLPLSPDDRAVRSTICLRIRRTPSASVPAFPSRRQLDFGSKPGCATRSQGKNPRSTSPWIYLKQVLPTTGTARSRCLWSGDHLVSIPTCDTTYAKCADWFDRHLLSSLWTGSFRSSRHPNFCTNRTLGDLGLKKEIYSTKSPMKIDAKLTDFSGHIEAAILYKVRQCIQ